MAGYFTSLVALAICYLICQTSSRPSGDTRSHSLSNDASQKTSRLVRTYNQHPQYIEFTDDMHRQLPPLDYPVYGNQEMPYGDPMNAALPHQPRHPPEANDNVMQNVPANVERYNAPVKINGPYQVPNAGNRPKIERKKKNKHKVNYVDMSGPGGSEIILPTSTHHQPYPVQKTPIQRPPKPSKNPIAPGPVFKDSDVMYMMMKPFSPEEYIRSNFVRKRSDGSEHNTLVPRNKNMNSLFTSTSGRRKRSLKQSKVNCRKVRKRSTSNQETEDNDYKCGFPNIKVEVDVSCCSAKKPSFEGSKLPTGCYGMYCNTSSQSLGAVKIVPDDQKPPLGVIQPIGLLNEPVVWGSAAMIQPTSIDKKPVVLGMKNFGVPPGVIQPRGLVDEQIVWGKNVHSPSNVMQPVDLGNGLLGTGHLLPPPGVIQPRGLVDEPIVWGANLHSPLGVIQPVDLGNHLLGTKDLLPPAGVIQPRGIVNEPVVWSIKDQEPLSGIIQPRILNNKPVVWSTNPQEAFLPVNAPNSIQLPGPMTWNMNGKPGELPTELLPHYASFPNQRTIHPRGHADDTFVWSGINPPFAPLPCGNDLTPAVHNPLAGALPPAFGQVESRSSPGTYHEPLAQSLPSGGNVNYIAPPLDSSFTWNGVAASLFDKPPENRDHGFVGYSPAINSGSTTFQAPNHGDSRAFIRPEFPDEGAPHYFSPKHVGPYTQVPFATGLDHNAPYYGPSDPRNYEVYPHNFPYEWQIASPIYESHARKGRSGLQADVNILFSKSDALQMQEDNIASVPSKNDYAFEQTGNKLKMPVTATQLLRPTRDDLLDVRNSDQENREKMKREYAENADLYARSFVLRKAFQPP